jgi:probable phosphoglycerate mutase
MAGMKLLLLLRHAATEHTGARLSGWTPGLHLSAAGREQAAALAERLRPVRLDAVYSSPLERCLETAAAVAAPRGLEVATLEAVGEVRYGAWTGRPLKELARLALWQTVQRQPSAARFPEGESLYEMQARSVAALERLRGAHPGQTVAVCSHADVIKAVVAHYLGMHLDLFQRLVVGPASLTAVGFTPVPHLLRLNDGGGAGDLVASPRRRRRPAAAAAAPGADREEPAHAQP